VARSRGQVGLGLLLHLHVLKALLRVLVRLRRVLRHRHVLPIHLLFESLRLGESCLLLLASRLGLLFPTHSSGSRLLSFVLAREDDLLLAEMAVRVVLHDLLTLEVGLVNHADLVLINILLRLFGLLRLARSVRSLALDVGVLGRQLYLVLRNGALFFHTLLQNSGLLIPRNVEEDLSLLRKVLVLSDSLPRSCLLERRVVFSRSILLVQGSFS